MKSSLLKVYPFLFFLYLTGIINPCFSQPISPVTITGYNNDVIAESGTSSLTTTTISLDAPIIANKVMYTLAFRTANGFAGGGIPDNGVIPDPTGGVYQLAPYNSSNALLVQRGQTGNFILPTPSKFNMIRILAFSTEGPSLINATLFFTDGSSTTALTNYSLPDWFDGTSNVVLQGFGRCRRATPATAADAFPNNPRLYFVEIQLSCADKIKDLQRINLSNVTTAGTNAPYPNAVFFGVSGRALSQNVNTSTTNATCTGNGSATVNITGSAGPYSVSWNSAPVQTGLTAINLTAGNYIATITDAGGCITTSNIMVGLNNNLVIATHNDTTICSGASFNANITGNAATYSWSPLTGVSNPSIANPVLSPSDTTVYTITGILGSCPSLSRSFRVNVIPPVQLNIPAGKTICKGASFTPGISGNGTTYVWSPVTGVSDPNIANPVLSPIATTNYVVTALKGNCNIQKSFTVNVVPGVTVFAGSDLTTIEGQSVQLAGSGSAGTYLWTPASGLSSTSILNPVANPSVTTTYVLSITSPLGCTETDDVIVTVVPYCIKPMDAITPNGDGKNDQWLVSNGNCLSRIKVKVFNRYGSPVYENDDYKNDWQGTFKGKPLPDATYYYVIEYYLVSGRKVYKNGDLTILR